MTTSALIAGLTIGSALSCRHRSSSEDASHPASQPSSLIWNGRDPIPAFSEGHSVTGWLNTKAAPTLERLRGQIVVIDFWASWCGPCIAEGLPSLAAVIKDKGKEGVIGLAITNQSADEPEVAAIMRKPQFESLIMGVGARDWFESERVTAVPRTVIYDQRGERVFDKAGASAAEIREIVDGLLGRHPTQPVTWLAPGEAAGILSTGPAKNADMANVDLRLLVARLDSTLSASGNGSAAALSSEDLHALLDFYRQSLTPDTARAQIVRANTIRGVIRIYPKAAVKPDQRQEMLAFLLSAIPATQGSGDPSPSVYGMAALALEMLSPHLSAKECERAARVSRDAGRRLARSVTNLEEAQACVRLEHAAYVLGGGRESAGGKTPLGTAATHRNSMDPAKPQSPELAGYFAFERAFPGADGKMVSKADIEKLLKEVAAADFKSETGLLKRWFFLSGVPGFSTTAEGKSSLQSGIYVMYRVERGRDWELDVMYMDALWAVGIDLLSPDQRRELRRLIHSANDSHSSDLSSPLYWSRLRVERLLSLYERR